MAQQQANYYDLPRQILHRLGERRALDRRSQHRRPALAGTGDLLAAPRGEVLRKRDPVHEPAPPQREIAGESGARTRPRLQASGPPTSRPPSSSTKRCSNPPRRWLNSGPTRSPRWASKNSPTRSKSPTRCWPGSPRARPSATTGRSPSATSRASRRRTSGSARWPAPASSSRRRGPTTRAIRRRRRPTGPPKKSKPSRKKVVDKHNNHLHANMYPNTAGPGQPQVCEAGNENYIPGQTTIGNLPAADVTKNREFTSREQNVYGEKYPEATLKALGLAKPKSSSKSKSKGREVKLRFWRRHDEIPVVELSRVNPMRAGVIMLVAIAVVVYFGFTKKIPFKHGYTIHAEFASALDIHAKSPVRVAGVNVGQGHLDQARGQHRPGDDGNRTQGAADPRRRDHEAAPPDLPRRQLVRRTAARAARRRPNCTPAPRSRSPRPRTRCRSTSCSTRSTPTRAKTCSTS